MPDALSTDPTLPRIFVFCNTRCDGGEWHHGMAMAEDGHVLAEHVSSAHAWLLHDLGVHPMSAPRDEYPAHYPQGFVLEFVEDVVAHAGLQAAIARNKALPDVPAQDEAR